MTLTRAATQSGTSGTPDRRRKSPVTTLDRRRNSRLFTSMAVTRTAAEPEQPATPPEPTAPAEPLTRAALVALERERDAALRAGDLTSMLHADAAAYPLLSAEEELALARRMRDPQLSERAREEARHRFVNSNIRLVSQIARRYASTRDAVGWSLDDLIQEGVIGLMRAAEKYDPDSGNRFSTYATWWIRQVIARALIDKGSAIRMSSYMVERQRTLLRLREELARATGVEPDVEALARAARCTIGQAEDALALMHIDRWPLSLDETLVASLHGGDPFNLGDITPDPEAEERFEQAETRADLSAPESDATLALIRRLLTPASKARYRRRNRDIERELYIIWRRHVSEPRAVLDKLARELHMSRERVRQLELQGMDLIRRERALVRREAKRDQQPTIHTPSTQSTQQQREA